MGVAQLETSRIFEVPQFKPEEKQIPLIPA
jgi:hypothetical protein